MGPRSMTAEISSPLPPPTPRALTSMGPRSDDRGKMPAATDIRTGNHFNGAALHDRGNPQLPRIKGKFADFNGAALR